MVQQHLHVNCLSRSKMNQLCREAMDGAEVALNYARLLHKRAESMHRGDEVLIRLKDSYIVSPYSRETIALSRVPPVLNSLQRKLSSLKTISVESALEAGEVTRSSLELIGSLEYFIFEEKPRGHYYDPGVGHSHPVRSVQRPDWKLPVKVAVVGRSASRYTAWEEIQKLDEQGYILLFTDEAIGQLLGHP